MVKSIKATEVKARRSHDEVKAARIEREERLAAKQKARAEKMATAAKLAEEKVKIAEARKAQIEANVPVRREKAEVPTIKESAIKKMTREIQQFAKRLGAENGVSFEEINPRVTRRGSGFAVHLSAQVEGAVKAVKAAAGATREATRFLANAKLVGLKPSLLGKEVQLAGEKGSFTVLGLKGRTNEVVLQKVGTEDVKTVACDEFKSHMVAA